MFLPLFHSFLVPFYHPVFILPLGRVLGYNRSVFREDLKFSSKQKELYLPSFSLYF